MGGIRINLDVSAGEKYFSFEVSFCTISSPSNFTTPNAIIGNKCQPDRLYILYVCMYHSIAGFTLSHRPPRVEMGQGRRFWKLEARRAGGRSTAGPQRAMEDAKPSQRPPSCDDVWLRFACKFPHLHAQTRSALLFLMNLGILLVMHSHWG